MYIVEKMTNGKYETLGKHTKFLDAVLSFPDNLEHVRITRIVNGVTNTYWYFSLGNLIEMREDDPEWMKLNFGN